uniref:NADH-ubiquinone oxidoreductase chain 4L n=1 Tax=Boulengerula boulengeri TaxID=260983 RepID=C9D876_BOUBO|nr:NADH dehydrogenase subunit 4L [Boulengerula boulengeri]ACS37009.1 NADH dehydrogenase subunit 4L [Boulengerula boulengeri]
MTPMNFTIFSAFALGMFGLVLHRMHLLSALICLEGMMLSLYTAISVWTVQFDSTLTMLIPMVLLTFSACEAGTGLAIMAATARTHGSDLMQNLNILQC